MAVLQYQARDESLTRFWDTRPVYTRRVHRTTRVGNNNNNRECLTLGRGTNFDDGREINDASPAYCSFIGLHNRAIVQQRGLSREHDAKMWMANEYARV